MRPRPLSADEIREAILQGDRNYKAAAALLGIGSATLYSRIKKLRAEGEEIPGPMGHIRRAERHYKPNKKEIERVTEEIRAGWPPGEEVLRAKWAHCGEYEIPRVELEEDTRNPLY